jgi:hypothetical protein
MIRLQRHRAEKTESLFVDKLNPFFDSIGQPRRFGDVGRMSAHRSTAAL